MTAPTDATAQRESELQACLAEITATLAKYNATFQVVEQISYPNGVAKHVHQVQVVSR